MEQVSVNIFEGLRPMIICHGGEISPVDGAKVQELGAVILPSLRLFVRDGL